MYVKRVGNDIILLVIYVDDIIVTSSEEKTIEQIKNNIRKYFDITDLGHLHYYLGVEVWQTGSSIFISQSKYAKALLDRFRMTNCKISSTPMENGLKFSTQTDSKEVNESTCRELVRSLIYLTNIRPDLCFAISYISRFMTAPKVEHWTAAKRVLRYVKRKLDFGILYNKSKESRLSGYTDSNWAGSVDDRKSTSIYVITLGIGVVTWTSKKQHAAALSSTEEEYRGAVKGACEAVWLRRMLSRYAYATNRAHNPLL